MKEDLQQYKFAKIWTREEFIQNVRNRFCLNKGKSFWEKVKKSAKLNSVKKSAKKGRLTSSKLCMYRYGVLSNLLVILLGLASQIMIFGGAPPKSKAS
jgi:hypothetical protein